MKSETIRHFDLLADLESTNKKCISHVVDLLKITKSKIDDSISKLQDGEASGCESYLDDGRYDLEQAISFLSHFVNPLDTNPQAR